MPTLQPFRIVAETDEINFFGFSGDVSSTVGKGTLVKILGSGFQSHDNPVSDLGNFGASYDNTVSHRFGATWKIGLCQTGAGGTQDEPLGILAWDVREFDEHGQKLQFSPEDQANKQCALSGQAVPVITNGVVLYSGTLTQGGEGSVAANTTVYAGANGEITTASDGKKVGKTLGAVDGNLHVLLRVDL